MATSSTASLILLLLLSAVTVSLPLHESQMRAFDDRLAAVEIAAFQTAPFEDALAESETIDVRRHYHKLPVKQAGPSADLHRTVAYPRESIAAADRRAQTVVVFYHGEKANATNITQSSSCPTVPSC